MSEKKRTRESNPDFSLDKKLKPGDDGPPKVLKAVSLKSRISTDLSRRNFLKGGITSGAGAVAATALAGCGDDSKKEKRCASRFHFAHIGATSARFSPDGTKIVSGGYDIKIWEVSTGKLLMTSAGQGRSVSFSQEGNRIISGASDGAKILDASTGELLLAYAGHTPVYSVAFSPDGKKFASGSFYNTVHVCDAETGELLVTYTGQNANTYNKVGTQIAFSPDGAKIASGDSDTVDVWDATTGSRLLTYSGHSGTIYDIAFSPDGSKIACGAWQDLNIHLWDSITGLFEKMFTASPPEYFAPRWISAISFSPDGARIAGGTRKGLVQIWNVAEENLLLTIDLPVITQTLIVSDIDFSPNGDQILICSNQEYNDPPPSSDMQIIVCDSTTGEILLDLRDLTVLREEVKPCDSGNGTFSNCNCDLVCSCDKVCTCDSECSCESVSSSHYWFPN